jgi:hypothetical protein
LFDELRQETQKTLSPAEENHAAPDTQSFFWFPLNRTASLKIREYSPDSVFVDGPDFPTVDWNLQIYGEKILIPLCHWFFCITIYSWGQLGGTIYCDLFFLSIGIKTLTPVRDQVPSAFAKEFA